MKFSFLPSLGALTGWGFSRFGQTSFQAPHHATSLGPGHIRYPAYVFNDQGLFVGNSEPDYSSHTSPNLETPFQTAIFSLDLSVPWPASTPAWHKIDRPADFVPDDSANPTGQMVMNKDGSIIYFFQDSSVRPYYVHRGEWGPVVNLISEFNIVKSLMVDSDLGHIYCTDMSWHWPEDETWTLRMFDPVTNAISIVSEIPWQAHPMGSRGVYSSARKSFFFLSSRGADTFYEYNIADKSWSFVNASGQVPSPRMGVACYTSVNNGKQILLVGGARSDHLEHGHHLVEYDIIPSPTGPPPTAATWTGYDDPSRGNSMDANQVVNDVFMFDVKTSVWSKVSTTPVGYYGSACAVSGDSLILYGGFKEYYDDGKTENDNVPSIYDMKKNSWVSSYIPH